MPGVPEWLRLYDEGDDRVRWRVARALFARDDAPPDALLRVFADARTYGEHPVAPFDVVVRKLSRPDATDGLVRLLSHPGAWQRSAAAEALGNIGDPRAATPLLRLLDDPDYRTRIAAVAALGKIAEPATARPLLERYARAAGDDWNVRTAYERALDHLGVAYARHPER